MEERDFCFEKDFYDVISMANEEAKRLEVPLIPNILIVKMLYNNKFSILRNLIDFMGLPENSVKKTLDKLVKSSFEKDEYDYIGIDLSIFGLAETISITQDNCIDELEFLLSITVLKEEYFMSFLKVYDKKAEDVETFLRGKRSMALDIIYGPKSGFLS